MVKERQYAEGTTTSVPVSQEEIQKIVIGKLKGTQLNFGLDLEHKREILSFKIKGMPAMLTLPLVDSEKERRRLWRCMVLHIKNMWVAVDMQMVSIEQALLPYFLLPNNRTLGEILPPRIRKAIDTGKIPALLPGIPDGDSSDEQN